MSGNIFIRTHRMGENPHVHLDRLETYTLSSNLYQVKKLYLEWMNETFPKDFNVLMENNGFLMRIMEASNTAKEIVGEMYQELRDGFTRQPEIM